jgi:uncharacterized protein (DUF1810 family)
MRPSAVDPYDLARFVEAQEDDYVQALSEIRSGQKRSHWMWYIFPQFDGLGFSSTSRRYSIKSIAEAEAYLRTSAASPTIRRFDCWGKSQPDRPQQRTSGREKSGAIEIYAEY